MSNVFLGRQGDVAIFRVADVEGGDEIPREGGRVVLAHGEVTGHSHAIAEKHVTHRRPSRADRDRFASDESAVLSLLQVVGQDAWLRHEEHGAIQLPSSHGIKTGRRSKRGSGRRGPC